jgi:hypothetical protein
MEYRADHDADGGSGEFDEQTEADCGEEAGDAGGGREADHIVADQDHDDPVEGEHGQIGDDLELRLV